MNLKYLLVTALMIRAAQRVGAEEKLATGGGHEGDFTQCGAPPSPIARLQQAAPRSELASELEGKSVVATAAHLRSNLQPPRRPSAQRDMAAGVDTAGTAARLPWAESVFLGQPDIQMGVKSGP